MWIFVKLLIQLLLSPVRGWEDVSEASLQPETLQQKGFYPLLAVTALSEFLPLMYSHGVGFLHSLLMGVGVVCMMCATLYFARLFLEITIPKFTASQLNVTKVSIFVICMLGLNCLYYIFTNAMPASMTFLRLLPILSVVVIFKSTAYMGIKDDNQLNFTGLAIVAVLVFPMIVSAILSLVI